MINNHNYYILVNKGLLIPKSVSRNIINFINIKNKDYAINDLRVSKYLTYEELSEYKKTLKLLAKKALPVRHSIEKLYRIKSKK